MTAPLRNKNHSLPVFQLMEPAGFFDAGFTECSQPGLNSTVQNRGEYGIIAAKAAIILVLWPDDPQAKPAPVPLANYTIPLCSMV